MWWNVLLTRSDLNVIFFCSAQTPFKNLQPLKFFNTKIWRKEWFTNGIICSSKPGSLFQTIRAETVQFRADHRRLWKIKKEFARLKKNQIITYHRSSKSEWIEFITISTNIKDDSSIFTNSDSIFFCYGEETGASIMEQWTQVILFLHSKKSFFSES